LDTICPKEIYGNPVLLIAKASYASSGLSPVVSANVCALLNRILLSGSSFTTIAF
jgi:hypothetical protein